MKRINLTKYGFVRWPEEDFSDDGNRFQGYKAGKAVRVSKLVSDGQVYLSISSDRCGNGTLPYEVYSKLPSYVIATWTFNGVSVESMTDEDLQMFYEACISYEKEYEEAEANIQYPTLEELTAQCEKLTAKAEAEYKQASQLVVNAVLDGTIVKLSDYEIKELKNSLATLKNAVNSYDPATYPQRLYRKSSSFRFVKPDNCDLVNKSWYLERIEKYLEKLKNN
jgi:hypothetical protein